jgi:Fe-S-cluster-containing dehydrogenase component
MGLSYRKVLQVEKGAFPRVRWHFIPTNCNQCANPPCVEACPEDALWRRDDGIVVIERERCNGCKNCIPACPYDAMSFDEEEGVAVKCQLCAHRIDKDLEPQCITTCIGQALHFGDVKDPESDVSKLIKEKKAEVLDPQHGTKPQQYYIGLPKTMLSGVITTKEEGRVIPLAQVSLTNTHTGEEWSKEADNLGNFIIEGFEPGTYSLRIQAKGRQESVLKALTIDEDKDLGEIELTQA